MLDTPDSELKRAANEIFQAGNRYVEHGVVGLLVRDIENVTSGLPRFPITDPPLKRILERPGCIIISGLAAIALGLCAYASGAVDAASKVIFP